MDCPPYHVDYASQMLADGAVALHGLACPHCGGFNAWSCGEHFHVGHVTNEIGRACKRSKSHRAAKEHIRSAYRT